jgi:small conductance mechanosensitive channel
VTGTVKEVGLFVTTINTLDNVFTIVGNNKIFSDNIQNFSTNPYRRVDLVAQLNHAVDHKTAIYIRSGQSRAGCRNPGVSSCGTDAGGVPLLPHGSLLADYFDTNRVIRESFGDAQFPVPEQHYIVRNAERAANGHALVPPMSMTS